MQFYLQRDDKTIKFLTKGDNNQVDDRGLYAPGQYWLERKDLIGKAKGFVPYIGIVTIVMNDYPQLKVFQNMNAVNFIFNNSFFLLF